MSKPKINNGIYFNFLDTYYDDVFVSVNLDYTVCFEFQGLPFNYFDDDEFSASYLKVVDALNCLDKDIVVNFVKRNRAEYRNVFEKHASFMKQNKQVEKQRIDILKDQYQDARAIQQYIFITLRKFPQHISAYERFNPFSRPKIKYTKNEHQKRKDILEKNIKLFIDNLSITGIKLKKLSADEVGQYCYYHLNNKDIGLKLKFPSYVANKNGKIFFSPAFN